MKPHRNISSVLKYLKATYREPREVDGVYDHLSRGSLVEWFYHNGELEENYKHYVKLGTNFAKFVQHSPILDAHLVLKEEICKLSKKHMVA
jgi:hypothetical protein